MAERDLVGSVVVARYRVLQKVASTATADVYEAEHVSLGTHVALKILANNDASSEVAARFLREGKTLSLFRHPNIVELLEVGRLETGALFLATELVRGHSLRELLEQRAADATSPLVPTRALAIAHELLDALGHAHAMGIVHRGMRPETVMVADDGRVKVLDFGVAKLATDTAAVLGETKLTRTGIAVLGDPRYTAPEVARAGVVDARADVYSVGAMLKELIPQPSTPQLKLLLSESTQASADLRYRTAAEMRDAVDAAIASLDEISVVASAVGAAASVSAAVRAPASGVGSSGVVTSAAAPTVSQGWSMDSAPTRASSPITEQPAAVEPGGSSSRSSAPYLPGVSERPSKAHIVPSSPQPVSADPLFTAAPAHVPLTESHPGPWTGAANLTASERSRPPAAVAGAKSFADLLQLAKRHRFVVGGVVGAVILVVILVIVVGGGSKSDKKTASHEDARTLLKRGHDEFAAGQREEALAAYERAIAADKALAANPEIRRNATSIVESKDAVAAVIALELLATRVTPPGKDVIVATAASGKVADVRKRAFAIAERDGFADQIDRVASLALDLAQATTCEDRRAAIGKLRATADKRAVQPLKKAKVYKCVERDAADAIVELEAKP
jgi:serine/threonine protein kinase